RIRQRQRQVKRELPARDATLRLALIAREDRRIGSDLVVEIFAERAIRDKIPEVAAARRTHIVSQYFAFPFGIGDVGPALRLVGWLDETRVDEDAVWNRHHSGHRHWQDELFLHPGARRRIRQWSNRLVFAIIE